MEDVFKISYECGAYKIRVTMGAAPSFFDKDGNVIESQLSVVDKKKLVSFVKDLLGGNLGTLKKNGSFKGGYQSSEGIPYNYEALLKKGVVSLAFTLVEEGSSVEVENSVPRAASDSTDDFDISSHIVHKAMVITDDSELKEICKVLLDSHKLEYVVCEKKETLKESLKNFLPKIIFFDERSQMGLEIYEIFYKMKIRQRMDILLIYISEKHETGDFLQAFSWSANFVVNIKDVDKLSDYFKKELEVVESIKEKLSAIIV